MMKIQDLKQYSNLLNIIIFITLSFIVLGFCYYLSKFFIEPKAYDFVIRITAKQNASNNIVNVLIDDQSITKLGRWPWDRNYYADIFEYLEKHGNAKIVVFDSVIISYDKTESEKEFFKRISKLDNLILGMFFSKQKDYFNYDNEDELSKLLKTKFALRVKDNRAQNIISKTAYNSSSYALQELLYGVNSIGSVLSQPDDDGIIRKNEPVIYYKGNYYPSLSLAVFLKLNKNSELIIDNKYLSTKNNTKIKMPLDFTSNGIFSYIKWYKPINTNNMHSYNNFSAWKIIKSYEQIKKGEKPIISPDKFKNKIVVVGVTATALKDIKTTSVRKDHPGIDIQTTCIDNILNNDFMVKPPQYISILTLLLIFALTLLIVMTMSPLYGFLSIIILSLGYLQFCVFISYPNNLALDIITPQLFILCTVALSSGFKYFQVDSKKKHIQKVMEKYVSKDVMMNILNNIDSTKLGGKRAQITALFADIRGFTTIAETLEPEQVSSILNHYFSAMVPIILKHNGVVDKFMGDALLAIFGAPIESQDHAQNAVNAAVEMLGEISSLQEQWLKEGKPYIEIGIGINTGIAFVGNIGSEDRLEYTAIGDTVNIASRLESFNKVYKTKLLISSSTYEQVSDTIEIREINSVLVKGRSEKLNIYEVKGLKENK